MRCREKNAHRCQLLAMVHISFYKVFAGGTVFAFHMPALLKGRLVVGSIKQHNEKFVIENK